MQAVLIIAHKNLDYVEKLSLLLSKRFTVYIHFDQKIALGQDYVKRLEMHNIHVYQRIKVNWGSWSIGAAEVFLLKVALANPKISYFHVISGQDWPIKKVDDIYNFFENNQHIYMTYKIVEGEKAKHKEPMILWQKYYFNYDRIMRRTLFGRINYRVNLLLQTILRVNKFKDLDFTMTMYHGANWVDIPRDACEYAVNYLETHPTLLKVLKTGCFSDEFWLQTIICNNMEFRKRVINDNYRFVKWKKQNDSYPAVLDQRDFENIIKSKCFFARKLDGQYSYSLLKSINKFL